MELEEAENIIDTMYQNKMKERETKTGNTLHIDMSKDIEFTELEEASVRVLREELKLKKELDKKDKVINKAIGHIEACKTTLGNYVLSPSETEYLLELLDKEN